MYDVIIVGSGIVGLVNALLLAKNPALRLAVLDAKPPAAVWSQAAYDARVYAITPASQAILESLEVWPEITAKRASPFTRMQVWDSQGGELTFDHAQLRVPALGYLVEENLLRATLLEKLSASSIDFLHPLTLTTLQEQETSLTLHYTPLSRTRERGRGEGLDAAPALHTQLLIGADGAQSWVREQAQLPLQVQAYQHSSLIAQVETTEPHQRIARQVFLSAPFPQGPLAFLPLEDPHQCSIVWSTVPEQAQQLLTMDEKLFRVTLAQAFAHRLGDIQAVSKRQVFPLFERHADAYVKNRIALIGDAAHTLHPLAGQGVNLGVADAAVLATVVLEAVSKGRDFASFSTLRRYERARKGNNAAMLAAVKLLKTLYASENKSLGLLCSQGLTLTNHLPLLKNFFAHYAMGTSGGHG